MLFQCHQTSYLHDALDYVTKLDCLLSLEMDRFDIRRRYARGIITVLILEATKEVNRKINKREGATNQQVKTAGINCHSVNKEAILLSLIQKME